MQYTMIHGGDMNRSVDMTQFKENPDGSATITFDFNEEEIIALFRQGAITALKEGIKNAEAYNPEKTTKFQNQTIDLGWDTIERIVVNELKDAYTLNCKSITDEGGTEIEVDEELTKSLLVVLKYFMTESDYKTWRQEND
jgi:hypothetical protein